MTSPNLKAVLSIVLIGMLLVALPVLVHQKADPIVISTISVALGGAIPMLFRWFSGSSNLKSDGKSDPPTGPIAAMLVAGAVLAGTTDCAAFQKNVTPFLPPIDDQACILDQFEQGNENALDVAEKCHIPSDMLDIVVHELESARRAKAAKARREASARKEVDAARAALGDRAASAYRGPSADGGAP